MRRIVGLTAFCSTVQMLVLATQAFAGPIQWAVADGGNGHFYELVSPANPTTWFEARDAATALGGHLVTITSQAEDQFIIDNFMEPNRTTSFRVWLGGFDEIGRLSQIPFGMWEWVTGEPFSYTNWQTLNGLGQPTGSVLCRIHMGARDSGLWVERHSCA